MGDTITITDANGIVRIVGVMSDPGATPTDVLTIDADEEVSAQPGGGGGSSFPIVVDFSLTLPAGSISHAVVPNTLKGDGTINGLGANGLFTSLPFVIAAMSHVLVGTDAILATAGTVVSTADALDLGLKVWVTDQNGANTAFMSVTTSVASPVTDTAAGLNMTTGTWTITNGADLTDDGSGDLKTTAGGVFTVSAVPNVNWD